jgi:DNA polymerase elongation subunit (family B)
MSTLIFDIETVGENWADFDAVTKKSLAQWIETSARNEPEKTTLMTALKDQLGFSPLTGQIVSLAGYDLERELGVVYYLGQGNEPDFTDDAFVYKQRTETELLEDFWESARSYDTFVTFNGRQFDVPFLLLRSIAQAVRPTVTFTTKRYLSQQSSPYHVDLQDELSFYGATRRSQLHLYCRAFSITSPKTEVSGNEVAELYHQGRFREIATYNAKDVVATTALYKKWLRYLAPAAFLNSSVLP